MKDMAARIGKTVHQVCLRWALQRRMLLGSAFLSKEGPYRTLKELWDEQVGE